MQLTVIPFRTFYLQFQFSLQRSTWWVQRIFIFPCRWWISFDNNSQVVFDCIRVWMFLFECNGWIIIVCRVITFNALNAVVFVLWKLFRDTHTTYRIDKICYANNYRLELTVTSPLSIPLSSIFLIKIAVSLPTTDNFYCFSECLVFFLLFTFTWNF